MPSSGICLVNNKWIKIVICFLWMGGVAYGMQQILNYENTSSPSAPISIQWPAEVPKISTDGAMLIVFMHPQCPCTKATVDELAWLMTHCHGKLSATVFSLNPSVSPEKWGPNNLRIAVEKIPDVHYLEDPDGETARRFGVTTSGQCLLYDKIGSLLFEGGITGSRGHSGDNPGRRAIVNLVFQGKSQTHKTAVFGCGLFNPSTVSDKYE